MNYTKKAFEGSKFDKDTKKAPEGSKADIKRDKAQMKDMKKGKK